MGKSEFEKLLVMAKERLCRSCDAVENAAFVMPLYGVHFLEMS